MIKKVLLSLLLMVKFCSAQDTLTLRNFKPLAGKIIGKNDDKIFLRLNGNNKIINIEKQDIFTIKHATGKIDTLNYARYSYNTSNGQAGSYRRYKPAYDSIYKPLQYGLGLEIGICDLGDFDKLAKYIANYYGLEVKSNTGPVTTGGNIFIGARLNKDFDLKLIGVFTIVSRSIGAGSASSNNDGQLNMSRSGLGLIAGYRFPFKRRLGFLLTGGLVYNSFQVWQSGFSTFFKGKDIGARLQFGVNVFTSRNVTAQGLIGGEYATANDQAFKMSFSGALIGVNIVFSKLPFSRD